LAVVNLRLLASTIARWLGRPDVAAGMAEARALLERAREETRAALASRGAEPRDAQARYAQAMARLVALSRRPQAGADLLRLAAAAAAESGLEDPLPYLDRLAASPDLDARARAELGMLYLGAGEPARARVALESALQEAPQEPLAHANLALLALGARDYERGWSDYEWRHRAGFDPAPRGALPGPTCEGPLAGRRVFVASEQGVGDEIMFASCLPDLLDEAAEVRFECGSRLAPLMQRSFPRANVVPRDRARWPVEAGAAGSDCRVWAGSLPLRYRRSAGAFPGSPYLVADPEAVQGWRAKLDAHAPARRIGLAWSGGLPETARAARSLPIEALSPLFEARDTAFVSLELLDRTEDAAEVTQRGGAPLLHFPGVAADLDRLAALVSALDAVICVPNAAAHLAGALGKPVHVLVAGAPTWRYGWAGERVDWYASMRVWRREAAEPVERWLERLGPSLLD